MRQLLSGRHARATVGLLTPLVALGTAGVGSGLAAEHRPPRETARSASVGASVISPNVLLGSLVTVHGTLRGRRRREHPLSVEELRARRWITVAHGRSLHDGRFAIRFRPGSLGSFAVRVRETASRIVAPRDVVTVFHRVVASWYGPGGRTACGEQLTATTLGVASPTLPCGTRVTLRLGARILTVPVIDRGPFVSGREYDLTWATKIALGAGDVSVLWATR